MSVLCILSFYQVSGSKHLVSIRASCRFMTVTSRIKLAPVIAIPPTAANHAISHNVISIILLTSFNNCCLYYCCLSSSICLACSVICAMSATVKGFSFLLLFCSRINLLKRFCVYLITCTFLIPRAVKRRLPSVAVALSEGFVKIVSVPVNFPFTIFKSVLVM